MINNYKRRAKTVDRFGTPLIPSADLPRQRLTFKRVSASPLVRPRLRGSGYAGFRSEILIHHSPIHLQRATTTAVDIAFILRLRKHLSSTR
jgi:hypothetical protein